MIDDLKILKKSAYIFFPENGFLIIAGRTSRDNDFISLKAAAQDDLWFHVRGMPGSHVLLRSLEGAQPSKQLIELTASVAVWFSKGRNGGLTPVSMTLAKNVGKPSGVNAGTVCIKNERIIKVRPQDPKILFTGEGFEDKNEK